MHAVTQRKCGTCRFYEAGAQHGSCRNPAYPRRDDVALLRPDELGCRAGWGKDYWALATPEMADLPDAAQHDADAAPTQPIPRVTGGTAIPAVNLLASSGVTTAGAAARGRRGFQGPVVVPAGGTLQPAGAAKDGGVKRDTPLENHPELNEQGIPYRNSAKRSSVAEAHRRALERREKERVMKEERERAMVPSREGGQPTSPTPGGIIAGVTPVSPQTPTLPPPSRVSPPVQQTPLRPLTMRVGGENLDLPTRVEPLPRQDDRAPMLSPSPTVPEPESVALPIIDEAVDRVIQTVEPAMPDPPGEITTPLPPAVSESVVSPPTERELPPLARAERASASPLESPMASSTPVPSSAPLESGESATKPRYWHDAPQGGRYTRMELPPVREGQRTVNAIGRQRPEPPPPTSQDPKRGIRSLDEAKHVAPPPAEASAEVSRMQRPLPVAEARATPSAPPPPEIAPRQIDEALLRQLETNWRTQELESHAGQRCGNCRFFRPADGGQGSCGCSFSRVYGQPIGPQGLSCLDGLGAWWAATDEGWLERTERRPRRATPLLDALLREREEELARSMPGRRRIAR